MGSRMKSMKKVPNIPSDPTIFRGSIARSAMKKSSKVSCAAWTACKVHQEGHAGAMCDTLVSHPTIPHHQCRLPASNLLWWWRSSRRAGSGKQYLHHNTQPSSDGLLHDAYIRQRGKPEQYIRCMFYFNTNSSKCCVSTLYWYDVRGVTSLTPAGPADSHLCQIK